MTTAKVLALRWKESGKNPLIDPPFPSPVIADPTFLLPANTPDQQWHLFAHSLMGIHHFVSSDGICWQRLRGVVSVLSIRPFLFQYRRKYGLLYEKICKLFPEWHSRIELRISSNMTRWSKPVVLLEPHLAWHRAGTKYGAVGNPCLLIEKEHFLLYYSAGLARLKDCHFNEPKYIGVASSNSILGPYKEESSPMFEPSPEEPYTNLGAGAIKVWRAEDGYIGFQNGIYWDRNRGHSGSAILLLTSSDGRKWHLAKNDPILKPDRGWKKSHVYALDVREAGNCLFLYFNARNGWLWGKERIGLAMGE